MGRPRKTSGSGPSSPIGEDRRDDPDTNELAPSLHRPVLLDEALEALALRPGQTIVDGTVGAGGHAAVLAAAVAPGGRLLGLDRDPKMLELARRALSGLSNVSLFHRSYAELADVLREEGLKTIDALLVDLGLSSDQLAWADRGFSFKADGPLDMRFDPGAPTTAADLVNELPERELADLIYQYGEERHSRRIARDVVEARKSGRIETTGELAALVRRAVRGRPGGIDPATRTFQALRIEVNGELDAVSGLLAEAPGLLAPGGRMAVISFHSLEDRLVKRAFREDGRLKALTKKPVTATEAEVAGNPRSRGAKLRGAERCDEPN